MATTKTTALALMLALAATPLMAQTTEAPATEAPAEAPVEAPPADGTGPDGLSMGTEVTTGDAVGDTYVAAKFEAWEQRCARTESGIDPCQLYLLLKDAEGNSVAEFTMFSLPEDSESPAAAGATFIAPLETLLTTGMTLQIDAAQPKAYPFTFCTQIGCVARLGFTEEEVAQMKKGATAKIVIVPFVAPDARVELPVSLKGFTAGLAAVDAANAAADAASAAAAPADAPADAPAEAPAAND
jgi:invasion protein IalB